MSAVVAGTTCALHNLRFSTPQPAENTKTKAGGERQQRFTELMDELKECQWYWGGISPSLATRLLHDRPPGTFLVRDSRSARSIFAFSYATPAGVFHSRIYRFNGRFCLGGPNALIRAQSLRDFVQMTLDRSSAATTASSGEVADQPSSSAPSAMLAMLSRAPLRILMHPSSSQPSAQPVDIRYPLCRNQFVPTLKGACRLAIRRAMPDSTRCDQLPVPEKLRRYLASPDYMLTFLI